MDKRQTKDFSAVEIYGQEHSQGFTARRQEDVWELISTCGGGKAVLDAFVNRDPSCFRT